MKKVILILGLCLGSTIQACCISSKKAAMVDQLTVHFVSAPDGTIWHTSKTCKPRLDTDAGEKYSNSTLGRFKGSDKKCAACGGEITFSDYSRAALLKLSTANIEFFLEQDRYPMGPDGDILK